MSRPQAGYVELRTPGVEGWRRATYVMGGSVRLERTERVEWVWAERPVQISRGGQLLFVIGFAPTAYRFDPLGVMGGTLRFNRIGKKR